MKRAFEHHAWATDRLLDEWSRLSDSDAATPIPGTYGSVANTLRHVGGADRWYLFGFNHPQSGPDELMAHRPESLVESGSPVEEGRRVATEVSGGWLGLLEDLTHDELVSTARLEGGQREAPASLRLAQALYHGTEYRSQIAVGLSALGATPPS